MPDPILNRVSRSEMSDEYKTLWDGAEKISGEAVFVEVFANNPDLLLWYNKSFYGELINSPKSLLEHRDKELLRLTLSKTHGCQVCNSFNMASAREAGITDNQINGILDPQPGVFSGKELAIIKLADELELRNPDGQLTVELYDDLSRYFNDGQIVEFGLIGSILSAMSKLLFAFDLVSRDEVCKIR